MPEPITQTAQAQAPAASEPAAQPDAEARIKELDTKYEAAVREMNLKQREAAELSARLAAEEQARLTYQAQLAQYQTKADPTADLRNQIKQAQEDGNNTLASSLLLEYQNQKAAELVQATATIGLMNSVNQALQNPNLSDEAKQVLREKVFEGGDPKKNIRNDKFQELITLSVKPGAFDEFVNDAKLLAEGRKVVSGKTKEQLFQEWTAEQEKRKKEAEMQSSLTQGGSGSPPVTPTADQQKEWAKRMNERILKAETPVL